jgi:CelD/BcsL family acetyltransferase involved in cellulose biosynthesis
LFTWPEIWGAPNLRTWRAAYAPCAKACVTPFMHPDIVRAWLDSHGQERFDPFFFRAEHPDGRVAFHLLVRAPVSLSRGPTRILMPAGGDSFDYSDPVVTWGGEGAAKLDAEFWHELERDLMARQGVWFDLVLLPRVRSRLLPSMPVGPEAELAPYLALDPYDTIDAYFTTRSRKLKREIERTEKKLEAMGKVAFTIYGPGMSDQVLAWLPNFFEEKARRYPVSSSGDHTAA